MRAAIGIDIGGTNVALALVSEQGVVMHIDKLSVASMPTGELLLATLKSTISAINLRYADVHIVGIGIGTPGANITLGTIEKASNLPWDKLPVVDYLSHEFGIPVRLTNDANLFAIGEKIFGEGSGYRDFAVITLGTGVGAGIYVNEQLMTGRDGLAGEVGHMVIQVNGRACHCGRSGCLERYVSASGLTLTVMELLDRTNSLSELRNIPESELSSDKVAKAATNGDAIAMEAFQITGKILGQALANFEAYANPEAIFLAGGLCKADFLLLEPTLQSYRESRLGIYPKEMPVRFSSIPDDQSGIMGAAALVWDSSEKINSIETSSVI